MFFAADANAAAPPMVIRIRLGRPEQALRLPPRLIWCRCRRQPLNAPRDVAVAAQWSCPELTNGQSMTRINRRLWFAARPNSSISAGAVLQSALSTWARNRVGDGAGAGSEWASLWSAGGHNLRAAQQKSVNAACGHNPRIRRLSIKHTSEWFSRRAPQIFIE
jgi:hypothetical protein